jgi:hypothetical protein
MAICGLFEYTGQVANTPLNMVVKQQTYPLDDESVPLQKFANQQADHIIKIYKAAYQDRGTGT